MQQSIATNFQIGVGNLNQVSLPLNLGNYQNRNIIEESDDHSMSDISSMRSGNQFNLLRQQLDQQQPEMVLPIFNVYNGLLGQMNVQVQLDESDMEQTQMSSEHKSHYKEDLQMISQTGILLDLEQMSIENRTPDKVNSEYFQLKKKAFPPSKMHSTNQLFTGPSKNNLAFPQMMKK